MEILEKLTDFQKYLRSIDQWHTQKTLSEIIADQYVEIRNQQPLQVTIKIFMVLASHFHSILLSQNKGYGDYQ